MPEHYNWDTHRQSRTGVAEAVLCDSKTLKQISDIVSHHVADEAPVLLTRLSEEKFAQLPAELQSALDFEVLSGTAIFRPRTANQKLRTEIAIVTAGTSDQLVAVECQRVLQFNNFAAPIIPDVGVAGVHRLLDKLEILHQYKVLIACAGMEGALFGVLAGLVRSPVIAVPTSVGYGVSTGGSTALHSALGSCSPGILTVNIDNGFGAACAAVKMVHSLAD